MSHVVLPCRHGFVGPCWAAVDHQPSVLLVPPTQLALQALLLISGGMHQHAMCIPVQALLAAVDDLADHPVQCECRAKDSALSYLPVTGKSAP